MSLNVAQSCTLCVSEAEHSEVWISSLHQAEPRQGSITHQSKRNRGAQARCATTAPDRNKPLFWGQGCYFCGLWSELGQHLQPARLPQQHQHNQLNIKLNVLPNSLHSHFPLQQPLCLRSSIAALSVLKISHQGR